MRTALTSAAAALMFLTATADAAACANWSSAPGAKQLTYTGTLSGLHPPLSCFRVTSGFGPRRHPLTGEHKPHNGIDLGAPAGSPAYAMSAGSIIRAERTRSGGNTIEVKHADGVVVRYVHLRVRFVQTGDKVAEGAVIGLVGATGRVTGPHLHLEIIQGGKRIDPMSIIKPAPAGQTAATKAAPAPVIDEPGEKTLNRNRMRALLQKLRGGGGYKT